jgi:ferredoxin-NADP reductase
MVTRLATAAVGQQGSVQDLVVRDIRREAHGVVSISVSAPDERALAQWGPGAHLDLRLGNGIERQYSLCGNPADRSAYRVAVLRERESRGGSEYIHTRLRTGDHVAIRGPRNHFALTEAPAYRFVAGGIGITPILPMVERLAGAGCDWRLLYGGRTRESMAFIDRLACHGDRVAIVPEDEFGLLDLERELAGLPCGTLLYCCGPTALLDAIERRSTALPAGTLHIERFATTPTVEAVAPDEPITVECARSGITVAVSETMTILDALREHGVVADSSCEEGICGTCETRVLHGIPEHRDSVLSEAERRDGRTMMICCSRAHSNRLVLDI